MRLPISYHETVQTRQVQGETVARHGASIVRMMARSLRIRDDCEKDDGSPECEKPMDTQTVPIVLGAVYVSRVTC